MKIILFLFIISFLQLRPASAIAQSGEQQERDSVERVLMKDSLQVSDSIANAVLDVRNEFFTKTAAIYQDSTKSLTTKKLMSAAHARLTNDKIKFILGIQKYNHYREMIQRWIVAHNLEGIASPLAGEGQ